MDPPHELTSVRRLAKIYIYQHCVDTEYRLDDLPRTMMDSNPNPNPAERERERERGRGLRNSVSLVRVGDYYDLRFSTKLTLTLSFLEISHVYI